MLDVSQLAGSCVSKDSSLLAMGLGYYLLDENGQGIADFNNAILRPTRCGILHR